jgi:anti-sigma factor (TIGR02949 family)
MNCREALDLLHDIIDNEASKVDAQQVRDHLKSCEDCDGVYKLEQAVDDLLRARLENPAPSPQLDSLKDKVLKQLDEIDTE